MHFLFMYFSDHFYLRKFNFNLFYLLNPKKQGRYSILISLKYKTMKFIERKPKISKQTHELFTASKNVTFPVNIMIFVFIFLVLCSLF